ncbi:MAG TPA: Asp-tRNA(Asn)/Glu-tRNA(Gln) amidotransferase subunit GatA [Gemmatimonadales bacterium]|jgi:aspartyl-tRNA(Asn)/glutamyl-tRNA(Gln) amidotransferase subunit A
MTPRDLAASTASRLAAAAGLNAALHWSPALLDAEADRLESAPPGLVTGQSVAIKDNLVTIDHPTTCASKMLEGFQSPFEATAVRRARDAGGMIAAKANLDEFAMGSSTEHSAFGRVLHPLDPSRVPGGSSGGSATLVAAGVTTTALGSETGGSVRQPASFCGVVGIKPTYGRVSRFGLVAFGSSLDCVSTVGRTTRDAALLLAAISGHDPLDVTTRVEPPLAIPAPRADLRGLVIGLPREYFPADLHPGVRAGCDRAIEILRAQGATIRDVSLPHSRFAVPAYYIINPAEAAANLARFDGVRYGLRRVGPEGDIRALYRATRGAGFGAEVRRRILVGTFVLSAGYSNHYYTRAQAVRRLIIDDFARVFAGGVDLLFTPTTPTPAFRAGEKTADPVAMYLADIFVCPASLAGIPALSLPVGRDQGLPIGGQLIAADWNESTMISAAMTLETALDAVAEVR